MGVPLKVRAPDGEISLLIRQLAGKPGAQFKLTAQIHWLRQTIRKICRRAPSCQRRAQAVRRDRRHAARTPDADHPHPPLLNEIGRLYVRQNVERKAAEAQKTLAFLDVQLPQFKEQLDQSEEAYSRYRNRQGTVALDEEAKLIMGRSVDLQGKLVEAQQRRLGQCASRSEHPAVKTLDAQIAAWNREIASLNARVKSLPTVQQDALRLERDVTVNNELYQQLRSNTIQLQLVREGKTGNVRLVDTALVPDEPIRPQRRP